MYRRLVVRTASVAIMLAICSAAFAQQHAFRQYTSKEGLAQSQVRCMAQDAEGYLWFGTLGGASRFDGQLFHNVAPQDGLPDAQVSAMVRANDGTFWMAAGNSIVQVVGQRMHTELLPENSNGARILGLAAARDGRLYIGTDGGGMFVRDASGLHTLAGYPTDTATHVRSLLQLADGSLLIGLRNGLLHCSAGTCRAITLGDPEPKIVSALAQGADGSWWVGTLGSGLYHIATNGDQQEYDEESGLLQNNVRCLLVDHRGRTWVGSKLGVNMVEGGRMRTYTVHQGLPNDNIQCAYEDDEGNLWFGTDGAGAIRYLGDRFVTFTVKDGLCSDLVMCITADQRGDLWLGTYDNGICRQDGMAMINTLDGLPNNTIWCGLTDPDGSMWFGTSDGIAHLRDGIVIPLPDSVSLAGQRVFAMFRDGAGTLWCGTREGLTTIDASGAVYKFPAETGPGRSVRSIVQDRQDQLWMATDDGLVLMTEAGVQRYTVADGLSDNTVLCLLLDQRDRLWAGTANGLSCLDAGRLRTVRFATDFGSNYFDLLASDAHNRIWAGTNGGLFLFHPDSLLADSLAFEHITMSDGLRSLEFNLNAAYFGPNDRSFFGTAAGMLYHDAQRVGATTRATTPRVHIAALRSFLQPTVWKGQCDSIASSGLPMGLHLDPRRHYLTFDYAAICFSRPERVRYRYRLVGYDPDWLSATEARFASYSNLPHGEFTFEVAASIDGAHWGTPASFAFKIDPPYWARWWFYLACAIGVGAVLFGIQRYRAVRRARRDHTRQLMLRSRMLQLEQQALNANMNRHFVFNALNSIQFHINRQDRVTASRYLTSFAKLIRKNLDASQNDTTTLTEELERLELYLGLEHMRFKDKFRYTISVDPSVDANHVHLPAMMLQPYVENSIWHGILPMQRQGHVHIRVQPTDRPGRVAIQIVDDGIGVDRSLKAKEAMESDHISRGIEITKGRADVLRRLELTDIRIDGPRERYDQPNGQVLGTTVTIELPVDLPGKKAT